MLSPEQFFGFLVAAMLITLSPGPDNLMVLSFGASRGRRQGMVFGLGCALGCLSHTLLATLGVSALIAASLWAFTLLKVCGGLYLVWLGFQALKSRGTHFDASAQAMRANESLRMLFVKGLVANAINPKVVLFFLAFLPQFINMARGGLAWQTAQLGIIFTVQAALLFGLLGYFSGYIGLWFSRSPKAGMWLDRTAGSIFVLLGLRLMTGKL